MMRSTSYSVASSGAYVHQARFTGYSHPNECQAQKGETSLFSSQSFYAEVLNEVSISLKCNKLYV